MRNFLKVLLLGTMLVGALSVRHVWADPELMKAMTDFSRGKTGNIEEIAKKVAESELSSRGAGTASTQAPSSAPGSPVETSFTGTVRVDGKDVYFQGGYEVNSFGGYEYSIMEPFL